MSAGLLSLVGLGAWALLLLTAIVSMRTMLVLRGRPANAFETHGKDVSPFAERLGRAHLNCLENLPITASLLIGIELLGAGAIVGGTAPWLVVARVCQSVTHIASTSAPAVIVRFSFLAVQIGIQLYWLGLLVLWIAGQPGG